MKRLAWVAILVGCGGEMTPGDGGPDAGFLPDAGLVPDAGSDAGPPEECTSAAECDDGLFCNGSETCVDADCVPGTSPAPDDGVACTLDRCDEDLDLVLHVPRHEECDDADACDGLEVCTASGCEDGSPIDVDDGIDCTTDACDPDTGQVSHTSDDTRCDDGSACTDDLCTAGIGCTTRFTCACSSASDCDDGNPCTDDSCPASGTCSNVPNTSPCDDGRYCNGADVCSGGACVNAGDPCAGGVECAGTCDEARDSCAVPAMTACTDDGNGCTDDRCDGLGACTHPANAASCDDGLHCNGIDMCAAGSCGHAGDPCAGRPACEASCDESLDRCAAAMGTACADDGNACTNDLCDGTGGCSHPANTAPCDDSLYCNGADVCAGGLCTHAGDPCSGAACGATCDEGADRCSSVMGTPCASDANPCTDDVCDAAGMCEHLPNTAPCNDSLYCNGTDVCAAGVCTHAGNPCSGGAVCNNMCNESADSCLSPSTALCTNDNNACTNDRCDGAGACTHLPNTSTCSDGLFCNGADVCSAGMCMSPGNPCVTTGECGGTCNETSNGCDYPIGTSCSDDGDACTSDACGAAGTCIHTNICCGDGSTTPNEACGEPGLPASCPSLGPCFDCACDCRARPMIVGSYSAEPVNAVAMHGNYAALGSNSSPYDVIIVDVSTPSAPVVVGTISTTASDITYLAWEGNYIYAVTSLNCNLYVIDATVPSAPVMLDQVSLTGNGSGVAAAGNYVYVVSRETFAGSDNDRLFVVDVSTPSAATTVGRLNTPNEKLAVAARGTWAFVLENNRIISVDVSTPSAPVIADTNTALAIGRSLDLRGDRAFYTYSNGFSSVNVADPRNLGGGGGAFTSGATVVTAAGLDAFVATSTSIETWDLRTGSATEVFPSLSLSGVRDMDSDGGNIMAVAVGSSGARFLTLCR